jgi:hypothetical protein
VTKVFIGEPPELPIPRGLLLCVRGCERGVKLDATPSSRMTCANVEFHSVTVPSLRHLSAIVFGRSKTDTSGTPPRGVVLDERANECDQREYLRRDAKK